MDRLTPGSRYNYIRSRIRLRHSESSVKRSMNSFVYDYLTFDGVFVMRIMSLSMSDCVTHELIQTLWQNYTESAKVRDKSGGGGQGGSPNNPGTSKQAILNQRYSIRNSNPHGGNSSGNQLDSEIQETRYASNSENVY